MNSAPMMSQSGQLQVVGEYDERVCMRWKLTCFLRYSWGRNADRRTWRAVPARFVERLTSSDVEAPEDSTVSLRCVASGSPMPEIKWRREDGQSINMQGGEKGLHFLTLPSRLLISPHFSSQSHSP